MTRPPLLSFRTIRCVATATAFIIPPAAAQDNTAELGRPPLSAGADTNDARAYAAFGRLNRIRRPNLADRAFYWASRLDPTWAEPFYQRATLVLTRHRFNVEESRVHRWAVDPRLTPAEVQEMDSLLALALSRDPFAEGDWDSPPWGHYVPQDDTASLGVAAALSRNYAGAVKLLGAAVRRHPDSPALRVYRAQAFYHLAQHDSAVADLTSAIDSLRARARDRITPFYQSVEMLEYAVGVTHVQRGDYAAARAALGRALVENLAPSWIHARLAGVSLLQGDTAAALTELELSTQLESRDPALRFYHGYVLFTAGRTEPAIAQLQSAIELDPVYAAPYFYLGRVYEAQGHLSDARKTYRTFLSHAARRDGDRGAAQQRLASLDSVRPDSSK